ncbi:MAG: CopG family transcriptional regulator [Egibacteraceae bacterium]
MKRTTIYLPDELKAWLERVATEERRSEADIIRESLQAARAHRTPPRPRIPLVEDGLGDPTAAERTDELLEGFGRR